MTAAWRSVAGRHLEVLCVEGSHIRNTMLLVPHVESLADALAADIDADR